MQAILQTCIQIEERLGAIYSELAQHPDADEELQDIWQAMAEDEARHAYRIRLVADRLALAGVTKLPLEDTAVLALLDSAGEILQDAQEQRLSIEDAVFTSVELEDGFLQAHLAYGDDAGQPDLQTMFKALAEEDRKHTAALKGYLDRLNDGAGLEFSAPEDDR